MLKALFFSLILSLPTVSALSGYYESFSDINDVTSSQPVAEPTAWFTSTASNPQGFQVYSGTYDSTCSITGNTACGSAAVSTWTLAVAMTGSLDYYLNFTGHAHRIDATHFAGMELDPVQAGGASPAVFLVAEYSASTTFHFFTPSCNVGTANRIVTVSSGELDHTFTESIHFNHLTDSISWVDDGGTCSRTGATAAGFNDVKKFTFQPRALTQGAVGSRDFFEFDDFVWNDLSGATFTGPIAPTAPAGLTATVTKAFSGGSSNVALRWPLSSNDPETKVGSFTYTIFVNSVSSGADAITSQDGDGTRYNLVVLAGSSACGECSFRIQPSDRGTIGPSSCTVNVNDAILGDFDSCGDTSSIAGNGTGDLTFTTPTDTAAGLRGFCSSLMGDSSGSLFLCGLILSGVVFLAVVAAFGALSGTMATPALIGGLVFALGEAIFNVVAGIWSLGAAILMALLGAAIVLTFVRKMFFGAAATGGDEDG